MAKKKINIIDILLKKKIINNNDVASAKAESKKTGLSLEKSLEKLGILSDEDVAYTVSEELGVPFIDLKEYILDPAVVSLITEVVAREFKAIPVFRVDKTLTIAMADPNDLVGIDEIRNKSRCSSIDVVLSSDEAVSRAVDQYYSSIGKVEDVIKGITAEGAGVISEEAGAMELTEMAEGAPIVKLVNLLIMEAVRNRASDIHIEPDESVLRIRYRIDGVLREVNSIPQQLQGAIVSRVKLLSKMNIAEKRKPQDGKIEMKLENKSLDLRVSSCPTVHGENVVIRILDKSSILLGLGELGLSEYDMQNYNKLIHRPHGIILVTGPTGSGKTSSLYSSLATINSVEKNIITIEDPVEYQIPLIRQTQVNLKIGLTFAEGLRTFLRQDPDVMMVGEIRDRETAEIAIQASLTGHLVFSTLHTSDSCSSVTRLVDMGVEPFLISTTLAGVLAQRLVRVICERCKEKYSPPADVLKDIGIKEKVSLYKGAGCARCNYTGFSGRIGIFELLMIDEKIKNLIIGKASADEIRKAAIEKGMRNLLQDGEDKIKKGITTPEEVLRVMQTI
ncbi:MAG: Flp pilus assembly complex ATPase component TadA [Candidatus Omnitrophica bacterium]|nr:Flp pilus assembly complex ATPase component TadA [Candidatus Omnitrophota bacterium]